MASHVVSARLLGASGSLERAPVLWQELENPDALQLIAGKAPLETEISHQSFEEA
ncbi:hypothetical protein POX_a01187 [Penicillium oxalicum]|uniref:Uncharacterized protein n=1 Tax=Penicillium oxalicum (strain 114-2 / CGMCC 5302) TaxID=933388 RepID=S7ZYF7_PENO1|nr:hypothetical protein POX_a01187 [Penicillium oxalicum]EPS33821.1 hypothetical protein PDE_08783 [Penicillium oxalicum 114-2]KAI2794588.1 hypothetical protein POX_a01187 [Penicillium oxalicum]